MSKRVTLTETEIKFVLEFTEQQLGHAATDPHRGVFSVEGLKRLKDKLNSQHPRSVETLGVSGSDDTNSSVPQEALQPEREE